MLTLADWLKLYQAWILQAHDAGDEARLDRLIPIRDRIMAELDAAWAADREERVA